MNNSIGSLEGRQLRPEADLAARIYVVGVGGAGNSAVNRMIQAKVRGVEFVAVNTDAQALANSTARERIHIGKEVTRGLGAGMNPEVGRQAALEDEATLREILTGADMVFVTFGGGGGTGSGAGPVIAGIARELGALTVAIVTKPFSFEGMQRRRNAEDSIEELSEKVDTIITIPNDKILQLVDRKTPYHEALRVADDVLRQGVQGISEMITIPGIINVDFADVKTIMQDAGSALMGIGYGSGENRAKDAAQMAISSPLLELSIDSARGVLFVITGSNNLSMHEINEAAEIITTGVDPEAKVIFGTVDDPSMGDDIKISVVATGFNAPGFSSGRKRMVNVGSFEPASKVTRPQPVQQPTPVSRPEPRQPQPPERPVAETVRPTPPPPPTPPAPAPKTDTTSGNPLFTRHPAIEEEVSDEFDIPPFLRRGK